MIRVRGKAAQVATIAFISIAAIAVQSRQAYGQACNGQYCTFNLDGDYTVQNDEWGLGSDPGGGQEIWPDGTDAWYASFTWQYEGGGVKAYPSVWAGWNFGSWSPVPDGFPVKINVNDNLPTSTTWYTTGSLTNYDVAYDLFFSASSDPSEPSAEMMVWLGESGDTPVGSEIASNVTLGGVAGTWNVWGGSNGSWPVYSFVRTSTATSFSANLQPFVYYLSYTHSYLNQSWFVLDMMFGCEIQAGSGEFFDTSFSGNAV